MTSESTVYVVDDDEAMRKSLVRLMEEVELRVCAFPDAEAFLAGYERSAPGCLLLDVRMPGMSGTELHRHLLEQGIEIPVIFITGHGDVPMATESLLRGAVDFIEKPFRPQPLIDRIRHALDKDAAERRRRAEGDSVLELFARLTDREREVVDLVVTGMTNKAIAGRLGVSPQAIDARRARAMAKLKVANVPQLVQLAMRHRDARRERGADS